MMKISMLVLPGLMSLALSAGAAEGTDWSYEGEMGPERWGELSEKYALCASGQSQSPVDLAGSVDADLPELEFHYQAAALREEHKGHTIQVNIAPGSFLVVPERDLKFQALQAHFHSPSEHTVDGRSYPMEVHMVHADEAGKLAVVGVLIEEGEENPLLDRVWAFMPEQAGDEVEAPISITQAGLLPPTREYFYYSGSLTTPPCSEGVSWVVLKQSIEASAEQIARFKSRVGEISNRPTQPHNARLILD